MKGNAVSMGNILIIGGVYFAVFILASVVFQVFWAYRFRKKCNVVKPIKKAQKLLLLFGVSATIILSVFITYDSLFQHVAGLVANGFLNVVRYSFDTRARKPWALAHG
jgi:glucan phosphoethanolaminetransferase (alkaline phosphatase superfamily)